MAYNILDCNRNGEEKDMKKAGTILSALIIGLLIPLVIFEFSFYSGAANPKGTVAIPITDNRMESEDSSVSLKQGDLAIISETDPLLLKKNEVVAYKDADSQTQVGRIVKVIKPKKGEGKDKKEDKNADPVGFKVKGDAENTATDDCYQVRPDNVLGRFSLKVDNGAKKYYFYSNISGLLVCGILPIILILALIAVLILLNRRGKPDHTEPEYSPEDFSLDVSDGTETEEELTYDEDNPIHLVQGRVLKQ